MLSRKSKVHHVLEGEVGAEATVKVTVANVPLPFLDVSELQSDMLTHTRPVVSFASSLEMSDLGGPEKNDP